MVGSISREEALLLETLSDLQTEGKKPPYTVKSLALRTKFAEPIETVFLGEPNIYRVLGQLSRHKLVVLVTRKKTGLLIYPLISSAEPKVSDYLINLDRDNWYPRDDSTVLEELHHENQGTLWKLDRQNDR
jgi:hypothetical protein